MAIYSPSEIREILVKLSQQREIEVKYKKFVKLGVVVNKPENDKESLKINEEDSLSYVCSVCTKKLSSAHLLDLHVVENHDSFFEMQKLKKPMVSEKFEFLISFVQFVNTLIPISTHVFLRNVSICPQHLKNAKIIA